MAARIEPGARAPPGLVSPAKRPSSATIASTPLEKLPKDIVAEATRLLHAGPDSLELVLKDPLSKVGLKRQGLEAAEVLAGAVQAKAVDAKTAQTGGLEARRAAVESRHALQLLAQVLWEANLFAVAEQRILEQHTAAAEAEAATLEASTSSGAVPTSPPAGRATVPSTPPPTRLAPRQPPPTRLARVLPQAASPSPQVGSPAPPSLAATNFTEAPMHSNLTMVEVAAEATGAAAAFAAPPAETTQVARPTVPLEPWGAPKPPARSCRMSEDERRAKHEKTQARRQNAKIVAEERHKWAMHQWEEKEKALNETWALRQEQKQAVREKSRERNRHKEEARQHYKETERRRQAELIEAAKAIEKKTEGQVARVAALNQEVAELMSSAAAVRATVLESNRQQLEKQNNEHKRKKSERAEKAQAQAFERRNQALNAKRTGPPHLRAARELALRQAARMERIRCIEREELRGRLEHDSSAEPSCTTSMRMGLTSTLGSTIRPTTPLQVRQHNTDQQSPSSGLPTTPRRVRPKSAEPHRAEQQSSPPMPHRARPQSAGPHRTERSPYLPGWRSAHKGPSNPVPPKAPPPACPRPTPQHIGTACNRERIGAVEALSLHAELLIGMATAKAGYVVPPSKQDTDAQLNLSADADSVSRTVAREVSPRRPQSAPPQALSAVEELRDELRSCRNEVATRMTTHGQRVGAVEALAMHAQMLIDDVTPKEVHSPLSQKGTTSPCTRPSPHQDAMVEGLRGALHACHNEVATHIAASGERIDAVERLARRAEVLAEEASTNASSPGRVPPGVGSEHSHGPVAPSGPPPSVRRPATSGVAARPCHPGGEDCAVPVPQAVPLPNAMQCSSSVAAAEVVDPCGSEMEQLCDELHACRNDVAVQFAMHGARMNAVEEVMKRTGAAISEAAIYAAIGEDVEDVEEEVVGLDIDTDVHRNAPKEFPERGLAADARPVWPEASFAEVLAWASAGNRAGEAPQNVDALRSGAGNTWVNKETAFQPEARFANEVTNPWQAAAESAAAQDPRIVHSTVDISAQRAADEKEAAEWAAAQLFAGARVSHQDVTV